MTRERQVLFLDQSRVKGMNASEYYRIDVPGRALQDLELARVAWDLGWQKREEMLELFINSDVSIQYQSASPTTEASVRAMRGLRAGVRHDGTVVYPPIYVYESDDNIGWVHPYNAQFGALGVRNWDGRELEPGDHVVARRGSGVLETVWADGVTKLDGSSDVFDIARNKAMIGTAHRIARLAHGVSCSTPRLAAHYRELGCSEVYVFPNSVIPDDYVWPDLAPRQNVRVLWQGGNNHFPDLLAMHETLGAVIRQHPSVTYVHWGPLFPVIERSLPPAQLEHRRWVPYAEYKLHRGLIDADINLCLIEPSPFNDCISCIKWYEASLGPRPAATLARRTPPYSDEIVDGETGMLFDTPQEFAEKLALLVEQPDLRRRIGEAARAWVMANRHYTRTVPDWWAWIDSLKERQRHEQRILTVAEQPREVDLDALLAEAR